MYFVILAFIAIASCLVWYLLGHDHGRRLPVEALWLACGFGGLAMVLALVAEQRLVPANFLHYPQAFSLDARLQYFGTIGFVEECAKFVPLALFIYRQTYFRQYVDGVIYFAICGLTFGLGENILYTISYGTNVGLMRLLLTPFLHAATTAILGFYLAHLKLRGSRSSLLLASALVVVPLLHATYDYCVGALQPYLQITALVITLGLAQALFLFFIEANVRDRLAWVPALARHYQPAARYCTGCGQANSHHGNYCEVCGHGL